VKNLLSNYQSVVPYSIENNGISGKSSLCSYFFEFFVIAMKEQWKQI